MRYRFAAIRRAASARLTRLLQWVTDENLFAVKVA